MKNCLFCKIIAGEIPAAKIYEDNDVLAFLDLFPVTKGHALVIPKQHAQDIFAIDVDSLKKVIVAVKILSGKIKSTLGADGIRISQSNGKQAGQDIFHVHFHIIPRYENDGVAMSETTAAHPQRADVGQLQQLAQRLVG